MSAKTKPTALDDLISMAVDEYKTGKKVNERSWQAKVKAVRNADYDFDSLSAFTTATQRFRYSMNEAGQIVRVEFVG